MPGSMAVFNRQRPRDINFERDVSDQKCVLTYHWFNKPGLNGFSEELSMQMDGDQGYKLIFKKEMETSTLEEILNRHLPNGRKIDFLTVGAEGLDFSVLKSNTWTRYPPRAGLVEILESTLDELKQNEVTAFLGRLGYTLYAKCVNTVIFTKDPF